jgi:hypothetical protein
MAGCSEPEPEPTLDISRNSVQFKFDELRVDKMVSVATNADTFEVELKYDDPANADWADAIADGGIVRIAVLTRNMDPEELSRTATVTVRAGTLSKEIEVEQLPYIETDYSIAMEEEQLSFAATGNYLTKDISAITKSRSITATTDAEWITSLDIVEKTVSVTVAENDGDERSAKVTVGNGVESTTFEVFQYGKPSLDISGTWTISYRQTSENTAEGWNPPNVQLMTGQIDVEIIDGGYAVVGIWGIGPTMVDIVANNPDFAPKMYIKQDVENLSVGMNMTTSEDTGTLSIPLDPAFEVNGIKYYSAKSLAYDDSDVMIYTALDFPITMTTEEGPDGIYEKLTFPREYSNNPDPLYEGRTAEVTYMYYTYSFLNPRLGIRYTVIDYVREVTMTRKVTE